MVWLVVVGVLGLVVGWAAHSRTSPSRRDLVDYDERAQRAERRLRSVVVERDSEHASVLTLRAALRSERQLLDGVANHSGVEPEVFRQTISKEYLGRELVVSPASLVDFDFGTNTAAEAEVESLQQMLRAKDAQLNEAMEQIHRIRSDVETLALAGRHPNRSMDAGDASDISDSSGTGTNRNHEAHTEPTIDVRTDPAVIDLCEPSHRSAAGTPPAPRLGSANALIGQTPMDPTVSAEQVRFLEGRAASARMLEDEVATLRARLADTAVSHDDIRRRIDYRRSLDDQLADIVAELETLRERVVAEKPPVVPDEDPDAVL